MAKYIVINPDGTCAGVPCTSKEEAFNLAKQVKGRIIGEFVHLPCVEHIHCPANSYDCPYYESGVCQLDDPLADCDDFAATWGEDIKWLCTGGENCSVWRKGE